MLQVVTSFLDVVTKT